MKTLLRNNIEKSSGLKAEDLFSNSQINLENEIEVIKSSTIYMKVIHNLNLNLFVEEVGKVVSARILDYPFRIETKSTVDSTSNFSFNLKINENNLEIINLKNDKTYFFNDLSTKALEHDLPFDISNINKERLTENSYNVNFIDSYSLIAELKKDINISQIGNKSDIISLIFNNSNSDYAKNVLNEIIKVFNDDGVRDRQLIHKRTIDFVDDRYEYLSRYRELILK